MEGQMTDGQLIATLESLNKEICMFEISDQRRLLAMLFNLLNRRDEYADVKNNHRRRPDLAAQFIEKEKAE
jgi:hypothetical protein